MINGMKLLVTGGAGYIGSVVAAQLTEAGHEVIVLDNLSRGQADALPTGVRFIHGDITETDRLFSPEDHIEAVLHFGAFIAAGESVEKPELYWRNNTIGSLRLLDALRTLGIKKLIFSSTAAVYGNPVRVPIVEDDPKDPTSPYGMTKLAVDMAIGSECFAHGLAATSLRYFNVAGAYDGCGERHNPETHIIPLALAAAANRMPFYLFGDDYPTEDGTCIRDYIHVADLARAHLLALGRVRPGKHAIYNLGNGRGFSNRAVIETVEKVTGKKLTVEVKARREGDPAILVASSEKARQELGWIPEKPALKEIIDDAWRFYQRLKSQAQ
jgi:UDP-glucose 4-epimerase